ncbi:MAG TPA: CoA pyrophosphatase [Thermoplasmata archaeon]|nr:CoA pyrophosphatase [Thermoplasmata archaeon]
MRTTAAELRKVLLPAELAETELSSKPASAVLVLLRPKGDGLEVLLGRRARRQGDPWSGQISFPGGHRHQEDVSLLVTALRETNEEVNLDLTGRAEVLGHLPPRSPGNVPEMLVVPFVAYTNARVDPKPGPEIVETFWAPLAELPSSRSMTTVATRFGDLRVPAYLWKGLVIWGLTFRILEELLLLVGMGR